MPSLALVLHCEALPGNKEVRTIVGATYEEPLYVHYEEHDDPASLIPSTIPHPSGICSSGLLFQFWCNAC
jgi:hypothetical protein